LAKNLGKRSVRLDAVEIDKIEILKAQKKLLSGKSIKAAFHNQDFFSWIIEQQNQRTEWDAVIGNPPYIRYQYFDRTQQSIAEKIFESAGLTFTRRTNAWVPFVISAVQHLAPNGRLALVLPAEIMHIMHASGLRNL